MSELSPQREQVKTMRQEQWEAKIPQILESLQIFGAMFEVNETVEKIKNLGLDESLEFFLWEKTGKNRPKILLWRNPNGSYEIIQ